MKKSCIIGCLLVLFAGLLVTLTLNPFLENDSDAPQEVVNIVYEQSKGFYSSKLPLIPFSIVIDDYSDEVIYYTIYYFPFGTVKMSYRKTDGFNIEKQLSSLS